MGGVLNPQEIGLFAGVAGARPELPRTDLGQGVLLEEISCFVSGADLAAALPGAARGAGGLRSPIHLAAQLALPEKFRLVRSLDRINAIWWFATLLRLRVSPAIRVPLIAPEPMVREPWRLSPSGFWPLEVEPRAGFLSAEARATIPAFDLEWLQAHGLLSARLVARNPDFNRAAKALDEAYAAADPGVSLIALWQALDRLFSPERPAASARLPANLAAFLASRREEADRLEEELGALQAARGVAEAGGDPGLEPVRRAYELARLAFLKVIEDDHVPARSEIESGRFRAGPH